MTVHIRNCPLCEAGCGLRIFPEPDGRLRAEPNLLDVFSAGHICPKGALLPELDADPDILRTPMIRIDGRLVPASWDEAFEVIEKRLPRIIADHGRDSVAMYYGNPVTYNHAANQYIPHLFYHLGSQNKYSASSLDAWSQMLAAHLMFGHEMNIPVPDLDRTDLIIILGANPAASQGSIATAPGWSKRLDRIRQRGGRVVLIDPRRTETARSASEHLFIRPGTDAHLILAIAHTLFAENLVDLGVAAAHVRGLEELRQWVTDLTPDAVSAVTGVAAEDIRRLARELAATPRAVLYGRIGLNLQELGLVASWALNVVNLLIGAVDRPGGAMFARPATGITALQVPLDRGPTFGRWRSRVSGYREFYGELPAVAMLEEMETPGPGQIRSLITHSGNPVLSVPGGDRLGRAIAGLDLLVCIDIYLNETTQHADVILPSLPPLERSFYPIVAQQFSIRSYSRFSSPYREPAAGALPDDEILLRLASIVSDPPRPVEALRRDILLTTVDALTGASDRPTCGDPGELVDLLHGDSDPDRLIDLYLRMGPFGDAFGANPGGINLAVVAAAENGVDFGPMVPLLPDIVRTHDQKINLLPAHIAELREHVFRVLHEPVPDLQLIGRRQLRSNNSWMHNVPRLVDRHNRSSLLIHPLDAQARDICQDDEVIVSTPQGRVCLVADVSDAVMPGVVCAPHGWGHQGTELGVASLLEGASINDIVPHDRVDIGSGNSAPNGLSVEVRRAASHATT